MTATAALRPECVPQSIDSDSIDPEKVTRLLGELFRQSPHAQPAVVTPRLTLLDIPQPLPGSSLDYLLRRRDKTPIVRTQRPSERLDVLVKAARSERRVAASARSVSTGEQTTYGEVLLSPSGIFSLASATAFVAYLVAGMLF
jgi:hypothetical protein